MLESVYQYLSSSNPYVIYFALLLIPFIENVFPPAPSDVMIVIGGTLITRGVISFFPSLVITAIGSELGFLLLYYLGTQTDKKIIRKGKLKFINAEDLETAEKWFNRYGYYIILFNRFISGIRSIISYFAGVSELPFKRTLVLSTISSFMWHAMLLLLGFFFGSHIDTIDKYLNLYGTAISIVIAAGVIFMVIRYFKRKKAVQEN